MRRTSDITLTVALLLVCSRTATADPVVDLVPGALDPQACDGFGCWTNHLRVTDLDSDGHLDILLANYPDFFEGANVPQPLVLYLNDGTGEFTNASSVALDDFAGNVRQVAVGDVDGDGHLDIYAPDATGRPHALFINDSTGVFTNEAGRRLPTRDYPAGAATRMGDLDGDGALDIFVADAYAGDGPPFGRIYLNDGTGVFTEIEGAIPTTISGEDIDDVELLDIDGDFDLDIMVNAHADGIGALWVNDGTGTFAAGPAIAPPANVGFHYNATPCDVDGDGDLDLWIDNIGGGYTEQLQINDGSGNFSDETTVRVSGNLGLDDNGVICADLDDDGDMDAIVLSLAGPERFLRNDGTGNFEYVDDIFPLPTDCTLWGEMGDLDGDGRLDLVTGQGECSTSDEVYLGNVMQPIDGQPPVIRGVEQLDAIAEGTEAVVRFAVSDRTVTDEGPRLARAWVVVDPSGVATQTDARFIGGDLFRAVLPQQAPGTVTFRACAEDPSGNTACSEDQTYDVIGDPSETTGDGTDTGASTSSSDTEGDSDSGPQSSSPTGAGTQGDTDSDGTGTAPGSDERGTDGCRCRHGSDARDPPWFAGLVLMLLGRPGRRRQGRGRSDRSSPPPDGRR
jgi:MYXO-CTERM domain-containing protein